MSSFARMHSHFPNPIVEQHANSDEADTTGPVRYIGNFHKTLPHDGSGHVSVGAYALLAAAETARGYEAVPGGTSSADGMASPLAGVANEALGPHPLSLSMGPAPRVLGLSTAAEMVELQWMALLRDEPLHALAGAAQVGCAIKDLNGAFAAAVADDPNSDPGKLQLGVDLPQQVGTLHLSPQTIFRCGLPGEDVGPFVSQFLLLDAPFGTQTISQKQTPYAKGQQFLVTFAGWVHAQNSGHDAQGRNYEASDAPKATGRRHIATMRDLARFVHRDALHQAYFNACLILLSLAGGNPAAYLDPGNPYVGAGKLQRQKAFASFGGPHILTLVSEVAARALKVVWHQKWRVHRRLRPEAYGGLLHVQNTAKSTDYGLPDTAFASKAAKLILGANQSPLLPVPFPSGSPTHPAYGAGHATVAGACVTILKAWFNEDATIPDPVEAQHHDDDAEGPDVPPKWSGAPLTVGGELNKVASNIAMGRTMAGVHWRSDNTRSLRLGEQIATIMLARQMRDYVDRKSTSGSSDLAVPAQLTYTSFDGVPTTITPEGVFSGQAVTDGFYDRFL